MLLLFGGGGALTLTLALALTPVSCLLFRVFLNFFTLCVSLPVPPLLPVSLSLSAIIVTNQLSRNFNITGYWLVFAAQHALVLFFLGVAWW